MPSCSETNVKTRCGEAALAGHRVGPLVSDFGVCVRELAPSQPWARGSRGGSQPPLQLSGHISIIAPLGPEARQGFEGFRRMVGRYANPIEHLYLIIIGFPQTLPQLHGRNVAPAPLLDHV